MVIVLAANLAANAHDWLIKHPTEAAKYQGQWVAVSGTGITLNAGSLGELLKKPDAKKYLVTKIPTLKELIDIL